MVNYGIKCWLHHKDSIKVYQEGLEKPILS